MPDQHPDTLHQHAPPPHQHRNANAVHAQELAKASPVDQIVNWVNDKTATVEGIILFIAIGLGSLIGYLTHNTVLALTFGALSSYLLQLVYLALLMYAGKKSDRAHQIQNDEIYHFSENTAHHMGENMHHLDAQDAELLKQTNLLIEIQHGYQEQLTALIAASQAQSAQIATLTQQFSDAQAAILAQLLAAQPKRQQAKVTIPPLTAQNGEEMKTALSAAITGREQQQYRKGRQVGSGHGLRNDPPTPDDDLPPAA